MAIKINFDVAHTPEIPTFILAKRNGDKIGQINAKAIEVSDDINNGSDVTFNVYKYVNNVKCDLWEQIVDFKLVYCVEWNMWFEISVELDESRDVIKTVFCKRLGHAELSQIMLYDIEINTENDINRDDYVIPTVLYNEEHPEASLVHRIMERHNIIQLFMLIILLQTFRERFLFQTFLFTMHFRKYHKKLDVYLFYILILMKMEKFKELFLFMI